MSKDHDVKVMLSEKEIPTSWYNIQADLPVPMAPALHPATQKPIGPDDLAPIFPMDLIMQEVSTERYIPIPDEVREIYRMWRPAPLYRALRLEKLLDTPAKIFYKYEGVNASGSHKLNTAIPQAYYNKKAGRKRIATETGAGQWGSALSVACSFYDMECMIYMVRVSHDAKPARRTFFNLFGADVVASPSNLTECGRQLLSDNPNSLGSLGIAISEAVEDAVKRDDTSYALGSVLNHVLLHQTVIGLETKEQLAKIDEEADIVIACSGGGSNFGGMAAPFVADNITKGKKIRAIAVEPSSCPSLTKGRFAYDYGDTSCLTPLLKMYTLGHQYMPPGIHAGGLRYHGAAPIVSHMYNQGLIEAVAYQQQDVFAAAVQFARAEGLVPAPESSHAIRCAIDEALKCKESGEAKTIVFNLSGHGYFDMVSYEKYITGNLEDSTISDKELERGFASIPEIK